MAPRARATRALALAAFVSAWTFACVTTFSRVPATPPERSGRFQTREDDARARAVFDAHAGHAAFAASARGALESRSRGVDPLPRPYGTARVVDDASNAERFDVHAGHAGFRASSDASSRWRSADYDHPPAVRRPSEDAVGMESAPELELELDPSRVESSDAGARSPPDADHVVDAIDQLDPHEVAVILVDDPTRPDETPLKEEEEERREQHRPQRHLRERDDGATDEGVGGRATTTETETTTTSSSTRGGPRDRPRPYDGVVRVVVAATRARRKHLTRRLLPALRDASDDADALDVRVHTSDADLCDAVLASDPRTRCEATETETETGRGSSGGDNPFPEDSAARREWYLRETADMIAALESAEAGGDGDDASASASAVLFLEDDVIPATSWETKLRTVVGRHATRDDATSTWVCDFDMLSLYAAGWDSGEDGHVGAFSSGTQALFFCPGGARETARKLRERFGEAPPDWLVRDATRDAKVRFAVPSLFQHGCERSTLAEKEFRHASKTFRFPATKCLKESDDDDEVEVEVEDEVEDEGARGGDGEGDEGTVGVVVPH